MNFKWLLNMKLFRQFLLLSGSGDSRLKIRFTFPYVSQLIPFQGRYFIDLHLYLFVPDTYHFPMCHYVILSRHMYFVFSLKWVYSYTTDVWPHWRFLRVVYLRGKNTAVLHPSWTLNTDRLSYTVSTTLQCEH